MSKPKLILLDWDGTIAAYKTGEILPNVKTKLNELAAEDVKLAIVSNQGGVGLRYWQEVDGFGTPESYPDEQGIRYLVSAGLAGIGLNIPVYFCFAYQSKKSGSWNPEPSDDETEDIRCWRHNWRKPEAGMLLQAIEDAGYDIETEPRDSFLMLGDWDEDELAAAKIDIPFVWAKDFFGWGA